MARNVWYVRSGDDAIGPFSIGKLREFVEARKINANTDTKRLGVDEDWQPAGKCDWFKDVGDLIEMPTVGDEPINPLIASCRSQYNTVMSTLNEGVRELVEQGKEMQALWLQNKYLASLIDIHELLESMYKLVFDNLSTLQEYGSERLRKLGHEPLSVRACFDDNSTSDKDAIEEQVEHGLRRAGVWQKHRIVRPIVLAEINYMLDALELLVEPDFDPAELIDTNADIDDEKAKERYISASVKRAVWSRDHGKCVQCGSRDRLEYDHIISVSKGGSSTERNVQLLCEKCNRSKGASI